MRIDYLSDTPAGTAFLAGPAGARELATVLVRTSYDLLADGSNPRRMIPANDAARHAIIYADAGSEIQELQPDNTLKTVGYDITYEADIALEKRQVDIVVEGFRGSVPVSGSVTVDGTLWLNRSPVAPPGPDADRNLFGWHRRDEAGRIEDMTLNVADTDVATQDAAFNNVYRRSTGFTRLVADTASLPPGGRVDIANADTTYSFTLPDQLGLQARYFTYCGHGIDKLPHWRPSALFDLRPDTLIVTQASNRAVILWRGGWIYTDQDPTLYRSVQILPEGVL